MATFSTMAYDINSIKKNLKKQGFVVQEYNDGVLLINTKERIAIVLNPINRAKTDNLGNAKRIAQRTSVGGYNDFRLLTDGLFLQFRKNWYEIPKEDRINLFKYYGFEDPMLEIYYQQSVICYMVDNTYGRSPQLSGCDIGGAGSGGVYSITDPLPVGIARKY